MNLNRYELVALCLAFLVVLGIWGCSSQSIKVSGEAKMESSSGQADPLKQAPVLLAKTSDIQQRLQQRKEGFQMGLRELIQLRLKLSDGLDSLKFRYQLSNYKDETIKKRYESITDTIAALKKETRAYKLEYLKSIAGWIGQNAIYSTKTNDKGEFELSEVLPGKYLLICVYEHPSQTGFLIKQLTITGSLSTSLGIQNRDPILFIDYNE